MQKSLLNMTFKHWRIHIQDKLAPSQRWEGRYKNGENLKVVFDLAQASR
jgi:hypothetical protein